MIKKDGKMEDDIINRQIDDIINQIFVRVRWNVAKSLYVRMQTNKILVRACRYRKRKFFEEEFALLY